MAFQNLPTNPTDSQEKAALAGVLLAEQEATKAGDASIMQNAGYQVVQIEPSIPGVTGSGVNGATTRCALKNGRRNGPDFEINSGASRSLSQYADTTLHEFGHAMDDLLGNYTPSGNNGSSFSNSIDGQAAILSDYMRMGTTNDAIYINSINNGDIVADLYEAIMANDAGRGSDTIVNVNVSATKMLADFGITAGEVKDALTAARNNAAIGVFKGTRDCSQPFNFNLNPTFFEVQQAL